MKEGAEMTCKDCIHYDICIFHLTGNENEKCMQFLDKADLVNVVRCKDCQYASEEDENIYACTAYPDGIGGYIRGECFCSCGERKKPNTVTAESAIAAIQEAAREFKASPDAFLGLQIGRTMDLGGEQK